jgi:hypothetical protein
MAVPDLFVAVAALAALMLPIASTAEEYRLARHPTDGHLLTVALDRIDWASEGRLVRRGAALGAGVTSQVEKLACDGRPLVGADASWLLPAGCRHVTWTIPLDGSGTLEASKQRSIGSTGGAFCLVSEASSLPRIAGAAGPEFLILPTETSGETFPRPAANGRVRLPANSEPPLLLLLGSKPVAKHAGENLSAMYFIDDPSQRKHLPSLEVEFRGLQWLRALARTSEDMTFVYAWLGVERGAPSLGGAAGNELLLVNYIRDGATDETRAALTAATPLIEASHQLASKFGERPAWAEESLATYLGLQALVRAMPDSEVVLKLQQRLEQDGDRFPLGLIEVQRRVTTGYRSMYAAFFTKGVAFWSAVDAAIRTERGGGLASRLPDVWTAKYSVDGRPVDLALRLQLSEATWQRLSDRFMGIQ